MKRASSIKQALGRLARLAAPPIDPSGRHGPLVREVVVQHKFVFDVGKTVDPLSAAERLLSADIGRVAIRLSTGDVFNAARLADLKRLVATGRRLAALADQLATAEIHTFRLLLRHPLLALQTAWKWAVQHRETANEVDWVRDSDSQVLSIQDEGEATRARSLNHVDDLIKQEGLLLALHHHMDHQLFRGDYLRSDPWIRVELEPCFVTSADGVKIAVDVVLVAHRTGTMVVTFYVHHDGPLDVDGLIARSTASGQHYREVEIAKPIVAAAAAGLGTDVLPPSSERFSGGISWCKWVHEDPAQLVHIFEIYANAIRAVLNSGDPRRPQIGDSRAFTDEWHSYPVICVHDPDTRLLDDRRCRTALGAILARAPNWREFKPEYLRALASDDKSIAADRAYWFDQACATLIHRPTARAELAARFGSEAEIPGEEWINRDQDYAAIFDLLLIQYHTVVALNIQVEQVPMTSGAVEELKARMLMARTDIAAESHFQWGTLQEIEDSFHRLRGIPAYWHDLEHKLHLIEGVLDGQESERRFKSERTLQAVVGVTAVVIGLPAISQLVGRVADVRELEPDSYYGLGRIIDWLSDTASSSSGPIAVTTSVALVVLLAAVFWRGGRAKRSTASLADRARGQRPKRAPYQYFRGQRVAIEQAEDRTVITIASEAENVSP